MGIINRMVEHNSEYLDRVFRALADPTRRDMLRRLAAGEQCVSDLAEPFEMSLAGASKHVRVLENAGLVRRRVRGRTHWCELEALRLAEVDAWLSYYRRFWNRSLDTLEAPLRNEDDAASDQHTQKPDQ